MAPALSGSASPTSSQGCRGRIPPLLLNEPLTLPVKSGPLGSQKQPFGAIDLMREDRAIFHDTRLSDLLKTYTSLG